MPLTTMTVYLVLTSYILYTIIKLMPLFSDYYYYYFFFFFLFIFFFFLFIARNGHSVSDARSF